MAAVTLTGVSAFPTLNGTTTVTDWCQALMVEARRLGFPTGKVAMTADVTGSVVTFTVS